MNFLFCVQNIYFRRVLQGCSDVFKTVGRFTLCPPFLDDSLDDVSQLFYETYAQDGVGKIEECVEQSHYGDVQVLEKVKKFLDDGYLIQQKQNVGTEKQDKRSTKKLPNKEKHQNGYSRIISFFNKKVDISEASQIVGEKVTTTDSYFVGDRQAGRIPHNVHLTKAELMLLRHKIEAD